MNFWLLTTEFPPLHGGGISTYCEQTVQMLANKGHVVTVFIYDFSVSDVKISQNSNRRLISFNPDRGAKSKILGFEARLSYEYASIVEKFIEDEGAPDFIETQDYLGIGYYLQQKSWLNYPLLKGIPIVVTMHAPSFLYLEFNQSPLYNFPNYWTGEMEKASMAMADLLISPSQFLIEVLENKMDFSIDRAVNLFNPYKKEKELDNEYTEGEIVFFGKLTPQKGCIELFEYLKPMWDNGFDKPIKIIGGDFFFYPQQKDMKEFFEDKYEYYIKKGLILFEGKISPEKIVDHLSSANLIIVPSIVDNLPYAVIEAMALGKMVLVSDRGGQRELIASGENGFIFSHNQNDFSFKLKEALSLNKYQVRILGEKARASIEKRLNYDLIYGKKIALLNSIPQRAKIFPYSRKSLNTSYNYKVKGKLLSVVIPFFNLGSTLKDTLESLNNVDYSQSEIIVVNDGSTDLDSIKELNSLHKEFNFVLLHKENSGLSETRNFGAQHAKGDYLAFLDADDTVEPTYYTKAIDILKYYENVHFVGCWAQYFGESNEVWPAFNPEPPYLLYHNMINSSALIYKKESFLKFGVNRKSMIYGMEDYDSVINMVKNGARGVAIPETLWNYRIRKNSMQQSFNNNKQLYLYNLISDEHQDFYNIYGSELSKLFNHNGPGYLIENPTWGAKSYRFYQKYIPEPILQLIKQNATLRSLGKLLYNKFNK